MTQFTIGKVAELSGVSRQTVRHYEKEGLLPQVDRTHSNYRLYSPPVVDRLLFIVRAKEWGLRLDDIKALLALQDGTAEKEKARAIADSNRKSIQKQIDQLNALHRLLQQAAEDNRGAGPMEKTYPLIDTVKS